MKGYINISDAMITLKKEREKEVLVFTNPIFSNYRDNLDKILNNNTQETLSRILKNFLLEELFLKNDDIDEYILTGSSIYINLLLGNNLGEFTVNKDKVFLSLYKEIELNKIKIKVLPTIGMVGSGFLSSLYYLSKFGDKILLLKLGIVTEIGYIDGKEVKLVTYHSGNILKFIDKIYSIYDSFNGVTWLDYINFLRRRGDIVNDKVLKPNAVLNQEIYDYFKLAVNNISKLIEEITNNNVDKIYLVGDYTLAVNLETLMELEILPVVEAKPLKKLVVEIWDDISVDEYLEFISKLDIRNVDDSEKYNGFLILEKNN